MTHILLNREIGPPNRHNSRSNVRILSVHLSLLSRIHSHIYSWFYFFVLCYFWNRCKSSTKLERHLLRNRTRLIDEIFYSFKIPKTFSFDSSRISSAKSENFWFFNKKFQFFNENSRKHQISSKNHTPSYISECTTEWLTK